MNVELDHIQRLNLHALLGAQRTDVSGVRALWSIQDKLALSDEEEHIIGLKRECAGGQERVAWDAVRKLTPKQFEFIGNEVARIKSALETWDAYSVNADRSWLEPLLAAFCEIRPTT